MTEQLQKILFQIISSQSFDEKIKLAQNLETLEPARINLLNQDQLIHLQTPGRPKHFTIVPPKTVPKRNFEQIQNRINFLHAIANIELLAIELPALCLLRFGSENICHIQHQLNIISEEAYHFSLLKQRLSDYNCQFGTLPAHNGLWDYAWRCQSELEHQILIPCYLEARGLDVSPDFIKNFKGVGDLKSSQVMEIILKDEIKHVRLGTDYLKEKSKQLNTSPDELFKATLTKFFGDKLKSKVPVKKSYRELAGFTAKQIELIQTGT